MKIFNKTLDKINGIVYNILVKRLREKGLAMVPRPSKKSVCAGALPHTARGRSAPGA